ncbi:unnamed protein product [Rangifer tarandus platyrhynchus]|uniref:Uncharacterized protein n=1 Tax=Rangifer tarandus platyrhynchus TaxID=3082113 RepID=A0ABN8ZSE9_RANTA|nr:unnamed protein product [Rangifer tarandus platyrhynchus]
MAPMPRTQYVSQKATHCMNGKEDRWKNLLYIVINIKQADSLPAESQGKPKSTGVLFQWIFPTQESNRGLLHCRFWFFGGEACEILAPPPGVKLTTPALEG